MNTKQVIEWGALITLISAVIGLGTALLSSNDARRKADEQANADRQAYAQQMQMQQREIEEKQKELAEQRHQELCEVHNRALAGTNDDFDELYREHGRLLQMMRSCLKSKVSQDQENCLMTVCVGAAILADTNCVDVSSKMSSIAQKVKTESGLAKADGCDVPSSAVSGFFDERAIQAE